MIVIACLAFFAAVISVILGGIVWTKDEPSLPRTALTVGLVLMTIACIESRPNATRISHSRVRQRARQELKRYKSKTGSNGTLDQAVGFMRLLAAIPF